MRTRRFAPIFVLFAAACGSSSPTPDAGPPGTDAGPPALDAGSMDDAGAEDAGPGDSGVTADAGTDAAVVDDAGVDGGVAGPSTPSLAGDVLITELQAAPVGYADDSLAEWIEIHNPSDTITYDLQGCVFADKPEDDDYVFTDSRLVPPGGYVVISSAEFTVEAHGFVSDAVYGTSGTGLSGSGDAPTIKCGGVVIDTVDYEASGFPVPEDLEGHSLQLDPGSLDALSNDDGARWCFGAMVFFTSLGLDNAGTPGAANEVCP